MPDDWKQRALELEAELRAAHEKMDRARARRTAAVERLHRYERAHLDSFVLRELLRCRAVARRNRAPEADAVARDARHATCSESYNAAITDGAAPSLGADRVEIDGLEFWVPNDQRIPGRLADDLLRQRRLPLSQILQTREAIGGGIMLDIGANIGTTSIPRVVLGDYSIAYAAEPAADNFACLVSAVVRNQLRGVVLPEQCAISDRDGRMYLRRSTSIGGHHLAEQADNAVEVPVHRLDTWVSRLGIDAGAIQFIKVDTQGYEAHVLAGAPALRARAGVVWQLEFSPRHLMSAGRDSKDVIAQLQQSFTWFIDLYAMAPGARVRPISELAEGLTYLHDSFTDLLVFRTDPA